MMPPAGIGERLSRLTPEQRRLLELRLGIRRRSDTSTARLSHAQRRMWFFCQRQQAAQVYVCPRVFEIEGPLDTEHLRAAISRMIERHEALRTVFPEQDGEPVQRIRPPFEPGLPVVDLQPSEIDAWVRTTISETMDVTTGPLFRAHLARTGKQKHILLFVWHHIVSDLRSAEVFDEELTRIYHGDSIAAPILQCGDYAEWEVSRHRDPHTMFWRELLAGAPAVIDLPLPGARPAAQTYPGDFVTFDLAPELASQVRAFALSHRVTLFPVFLAAYAILLHRYCGHQDLVIGVPASERSLPELDRVIGYLVDMLPIRLHIDSKSDFAALVRDCHARYRACSDHASRFDFILDAVQPERSHSYSPIFQVALNYLKETEGRLQFDGARTQRIPLHNGASMFELTLTISERDQRFQVSIEYRTALFDSQMISSLASHLTNILEEATRPELHSVGEIRMLGHGEFRSIVFERNATESPIPDGETALTLFDRQVAENPQRVAILCGDVEWTYGQLSAFADRVCAALEQQGIQPGAVVAVIGERTPQTIGVLLGVWRSGAIWLPVDPRWPAERANFVVEDAGAHWFSYQLPDSASPRRPAAQADSVAYILYTSGSTGKPKGVAIRHRSLTNLLRSVRRQPGFGADETMLSVTPLNFDISLNELLLPLACGGRVILPGLEEALDARIVRALLESHNVHVMQATPALWRALLRTGWKGAPRLRAWCTGEALPPDLAGSLLDRVGELWNLYGPTETTIWSTLYRVGRGELPVPIGRPIANTQCYVLDAELRPVPDEVPGELFIAGAGIAAAYVGHAQDQQNRFAPTPFTAGSKMYRTGDIVRWSRGGELVFLGRADGEVKVRGHRIDLSEVETALARLELVSQVVAGARGDVLVAWIVPNDPAHWDPAALRKVLRGTLPEYMIPTIFVPVDRIPLNSAGKVDRTRLPALQQSGSDPREAPSDPGERRLAAIWESVLGRSGIGRTDDFFELGGHSLLATEIMVRIEQEFGKKLPLAALFESSTVAGLAAAIQSDADPAPIRIVPIKAAGKLPPFFCLNGLLSMRNLADRLRDDRPFLSLFMPNTGRVMEHAAANVVRFLRRRQPQGPYYLGGWCASGVLAFEAACQLRAEGQEVAVLALFDSYNRDAGNSTRYLLNRVPYYLGKAKKLRYRQAVRYLGQRASGMFSQAWSAAHPANQKTEIELALKYYRPKHYDGKVVLFRCQDRPGARQRDPVSDWRSVVGKLEVVEVPGNHLQMFDEPNVDVLAAALNNCLTQHD